MLPETRLRTIVLEEARAVLAPNRVENAVVEDTVDSMGNDALRVLIVITSDAVPRLSGDSLIRLVTRLGDRLGAEGEPRFPIVEYATVEELVAEARETAEFDADSES